MDRRTESLRSEVELVMSSSAYLKYTSRRPHVVVNGQVIDIDSIRKGEELEEEDFYHPDVHNVQHLTSLFKPVAFMEQSNLSLDFKKYFFAKLERARDFYDFARAMCDLLMTSKVVLKAEFNTIDKCLDVDIKGEKFAQYFPIEAENLLNFFDTINKYGKKVDVKMENFTKFTQCFPVDAEYVLNFLEKTTDEKE